MEPEQRENTIFCFKLQKMLPNLRKQGWPVTLLVFLYALCLNPKTQNRKNLSNVMMLPNAQLIPTTTEYLLKTIFGL